MKTRLKFAFAVFLSFFAVINTYASDLPPPYEEAVGRKRKIVMPQVQRATEEDKKEFPLVECFLQNTALTPGRLTYTAAESGSGYFAQCLSSSSDNYNREREYYLEGGRYRSSILWEIKRAGKENSFIIRNAALTPGYLTYTAAESGSGYFAQCLSSSSDNYNREREYYLEGGRYRTSILWYIFDPVLMAELVHRSI